MSKGKGFGGMPANMQQMMKQAQKMQEQLLKAQEEAQFETGEGSAGGGMVKVIASGAKQITSITINPTVVDPNDVEILQEMIIAATNEALNEANKKVEQKMAQITGGIGIPGL